MVPLNIFRTFKAECKFYFDEEVQSQIFALIQDAKDWLVLVSPYNKHPQHLRNLLTEAIGREVRVTMLYRDGKDRDGKDLRKAVTYLEDLGAKVLPVKWLHSKIYMNESTALASSMNLLESSFNNSSEFCIRIDKANLDYGRLYNELDTYVERIQWRIEQQNPSATPDQSTPAKPAARKPAPAKAARKSAPPPRSAPKAAATRTTGHCLRCGSEIPFDLEYPYCESHYQIWASFDNETYKEKHCHACGTEHGTSMAKPVCSSCYPQYRRLFRARGSRS